MLTCKKMSEISSDYLNNQLTLWQRLGFRLHLMMCNHCRRFVRQLDTVVTSLKGFSNKPFISGQRADDIAHQVITQLRDK